MGFVLVLWDVYVDGWGLRERYIANGKWHLYGTNIVFLNSWVLDSLFAAMTFQHPTNPLDLHLVSKLRLIG
jgi:hypothetical protein